MNQLTTPQSQVEIQVPTTPFSAPWLQRLRRGMGTINGKPALMSGMEPTAQERAQIPALTSTLRRQLSAGPGDGRLVAIEVGKLLTAFPHRDAGDADMAARADAYFDALAEAPAWAVRQARLKVISGEYVGSLDARFAPTSPQFAGIVRGILKPLKDDLGDLERLASATAEHEPSAEERERVKEGFAKLRASLKRTPEAA